MSGQDPATECDLIERCLRGEEGAWSELIARYQGLIYSVPRRMGLTPDDAADVFQRVCILLYQRLDSIRDPNRLGGWLLTTAFHRGASRQSAPSARNAVETYTTARFVLRAASSTARA